MISGASTNTVNAQTHTTKRVTRSTCSSDVQVGPGLQCRLTSPRRLYTKLHLSRELELKTRESCLLGISARNEGQNSPSADKNQEFGMHSITFAPHRPQQKENQTNSGGSIEKCGAIGIGNEKPKRYSQQSRRQNTCIPSRRTLHAGDNSDLPEKPSRTHIQRGSHNCTSALKRTKLWTQPKKDHRLDRMFWS